MSNTNNNDTRHLKQPYDAEINADLPPLSLNDVRSNQSVVCDAVRLYLAVWADLPPEQRRLVSTHVQTCKECAYERQLFWGSTRAVALLPETEPSNRVDQAVLDAIKARSRPNTGVRTSTSMQRREEFASFPTFVNHAGTASTASRSRSGIRRSTIIAALAAVFVLALLSSAYFVINGGTHTSQSTAFTLPANLSWDKYVLYQQQTMPASQGQNYTMTSYHDMATQDANIEVVMPGKFDVMVVKDTQQTLGLDMMHHVAQWTSPTWIQSDTALFDLNSLRQELRTGQATYLGKSSYNGQEVYRIHMPNGNVLLLDTNYLPVNVLENVNSAGAGTPVYTALRWLTSSQVPTSTWDMSVPSGFNMGTLPSQP
jgi:hypothetical protein